MENVTMGFGASEAADGLRAFGDHYDSQRFVGRTTELAALDEWLAGNEQTMLVVAPAGRGKSALLWAWVNTVPEIVWVPISVRFDTARSKTVRGLLSTKLQAMGAASSGDWVDMAHRQAPVVVLDGLDECADEALVEDLRDLPSGVRVVVAARELVDRDANEWAATLGWTGPILELPGLDRAAVSELVGDIDAHALNEIVGLADGDPLTATLLADSDRGEHGFERWWESTALDTELLTALARAVAPAPPALLAQVLGHDKDEVMRGLHEARRFLVTSSAGAVSFAHPRLGYTFEDRLDAAEIAAVDVRWRDAVDDVELDALGPSGRAYVLQSRLTHKSRCGASASELACVVTHDWFAAWEALEGGTTGFLTDVDVAWAAIERELDEMWSDELSTEQMRLCAIKTALSSIERTVSAKTRAAAVRVGARGQRAAVASVLAIPEEYKRVDAIKALLPALDERGFDMLLHALEPFRGQGLPVRELAERLLDMGLADEAQRWVLEDERMRRPAIIELIDRFEDPEPFRAAARHDLTKVEYGLDWKAECYAETAVVFDAAERREMLEHAGELLEEFGEENLWWDSWEGTQDPRLVLAEAFIDAGHNDDARRWLDRVWANPLPFQEGADGFQTHVVEVWAKLGEVPDGLLERAYAPAPATFALFRAGLADVATMCELIPSAKGETLVQVLEHGERQTCEASARRAVEILDAFIAAPNDYGAGYAIYTGGGTALGMAGKWLPPEERLDVLRRAWSVLRGPRGPVNMYNCWNALLGLLGSVDRDARGEIGAEMMSHALSMAVELGYPPLCDFPGWWDAFDEGHRPYVEYVLRGKKLAQPGDWIELLVEHGNLNAARTALALARKSTEQNLAIVSRVPQLWPEIADEAIEQFEADDFDVWSLWAVIANAPSAEEKAELAIRVWDARYEHVAQMGCAGELLGALNEADAEEVAANLIEDDLLHFVPGAKLPPQARAHWIEMRFDPAESLSERAHAFLSLAHVDEGDDGEADPQVTRLCDDLFVEALAQRDTDEAVTALGILVRHLEPRHASAVADLLYEQGSTSVVPHLTHRLHELGLSELVRTDIDNMGAMEVLRARLQSAVDLTDLIAAFDEPAPRTYPWVADIIVGRGLAMAWAEHVATFEDPSDRLLAWNHVWGALTPEEQSQSMPLIVRAMNDERAGSRTSRWLWVERLDTETVRAQWRAELRTLRTSASAFLPDAFGEPLGLSQEHANAVASVAQWFTE